MLIALLLGDPILIIRLLAVVLSAVGCALKIRQILKRRGNTRDENELVRTSTTARGAVTETQEQTKIKLTRKGLSVDRTINITRRSDRATAETARPKGDHEQG